MNTTKYGAMRAFATSRTGWVGISIPAAVWRQELAYVAGARGSWSLAWRAARAAWRCARLAAQRLP